MAADEELVTCVRYAPAVRFGTRRFGPSASPLDFSAGTWPDLLLCVFLAGLSNSRIDWAARNPPRRRIPAGARRAIRPCGLLVCADAAMAIERCAHAHRNLLGGNDCIAAPRFEFLAAGHAGDLLCVLSFVRQRGAGFFCLSVGWNAAGGGIHFFVLRARRISAWMGRSESAIACESLPADMGRLPDLFRIGRGEDHGRRPAVAQFHGARRVLPERPAADMDRLAHATPTALVPCGDCVWNADGGTSACVDDVLAAAHSDLMFCHRDALADRHHPFGELHVPELPRAGPGDSADR